VTIQTIFDAILGQAGVIVLLLVILWSGWKRYWVFGSYYVEMQQELRAQLSKTEHRLDRALGAAETGTGLAASAIRQAEGRASDERPD
jgi:hypothetical protein